MKKFARIVAAVFLAQSASLATAQVEISLLHNDVEEAANIIPTSMTSAAERITVRERYANGELQIEKQMAMTDKGDFVEHGTYRKFSPKGDVLIEGQYEWGQPSGSWMKILDADEIKRVQHYVGSGFKPPLTSTVEFRAGKMNETWSIVDQDKKLVLQIELKDGLRDGITTIYMPNTEVKQQASFDAGVLDGVFFTKVDGKKASEAVYTNGQSVIEEVNKYSNNSVKSTFHYLSAVHSIGTVDEWFTTTIGSVTAAGERTLHGEFVQYHENGQVSTKGSYSHGVLDGDFQSWHPNGELACKGTYENGNQHGSWVWFYSNGMKQSQANFVDGETDGQVLAWDTAGKSVRDAKLATSIPAKSASASAGQKMTKRR